MGADQNPDFIRQTASPAAGDASPALKRATAITDLTLAETVGLALYDMIAAHRRTAISRETAISMAAAGIMAMQFAGEGASRAACGVPFGAAAPGSGATPAAAIATNSPDPVAADPALAEALKRQQATLRSAQSVQPGAATLASRLVAQSSALLVDDAAEALRGTNTLAMLTAAMAMARYVETGEEHCLVAVEKAKQMIIDAQDAFSRATAIAAEAVETFPGT